MGRARTDVAQRLQSNNGQDAALGRALSRPHGQAALQATGTAHSPPVTRTCALLLRWSAYSPAPRNKCCKFAGTYHSTLHIVHRCDSRGGNLTCRWWTAWTAQTWATSGTMRCVESTQGICWGLSGASGRFPWWWAAQQPTVLFFQRNRPGASGLHPLPNPPRLAGDVTTALALLLPPGCAVGGEPGGP